MLSRWSRWGLVLCLSAAPAIAEVSEGNRPVRAGWIEEARVSPSVVLNVKLDTGADHSSLSASRIRGFKRGGERYVQFSVRSANGKSYRLVRRRVRSALIKGHFGETDRRPVVAMTICIGRVRKKVEVNLVDRSGFQYPMLIGRSFLSGDFIVDPAHTHLLDLECAPKDEDNIEESEDS